MFLYACSFRFHSGGCTVFPLQGEGRIGRERNRYFVNQYLFISLFNCIGFSDVGLPGVGKSNIGFPNIGRFLLCLARKIAIDSLTILFCICYAIERHFAGLRYKSLPSIKMLPESRI